MDRKISALLPTKKPLWAYEQGAEAIEIAKQFRGSKIFDFESLRRDLNPRPSDALTSVKDASPLFVTDLQVRRSTTELRRHEELEQKSVFKGIGKPNMDFRTLESAQEQSSWHGKIEDFAMAECKASLHARTLGSVHFDFVRFW